MEPTYFLFALDAADTFACVAWVLAALMTAAACGAFSVTGPRWVSVACGIASVLSVVAVGVLVYLGMVTA